MLMIGRQAMLPAETPELQMLGEGEMKTMGMGKLEGDPSILVDLVC